jgi:hypothetical protein
LADHDFAALSSVDFECLTKDLLQSLLGLRLASFKAGKDAGRDFRHASAIGQSIIVHCKHNTRVPLQKLLAELRNQDRPNINRLKPARYLFVTSLPLSSSAKNSMMAALAPGAARPPTCSEETS